MQKILIALMHGYRYLLSPWFGSGCRFHPSCSSYAIECLEKHGALKGSWFTLKRVARCHPWHPGGHDPAPSAANTARARHG